MASNKAIEERVQALVAELLAEEAAGDLEGRRENINDGCATATCDGPARAS